MKTKIIPGKTTFRSYYADGNPLWKVLHSVGKDVYLCEILNEPFEIDGDLIDSDYAGIQRPFMAKEIVACSEGDKALKNLMNEHDEFYANLNVGDIIHYHNGFGEWVRCKVANVRDKGNVLVPIALVGKWRELPRKRFANGALSYCYYADKVASGDSMEQPNFTNLYEAGQKGDGVDPRTLPPLDLTPPPMTNEQERIASIWKQVELIRESLEGTDPAEILEQVKVILNIKD
jgi:hypothetical protein